MQLITSDGSTDSEIRQEAQPRDLQFPPLSNGSQSEHPSLTEGALTQNNFAVLDHRTPLTGASPGLKSGGAGFQTRVNVPLYKLRALALVAAL